MGLGWTAALFAVATLGDEVPGAALGIGTAGYGQRKVREPCFRRSRGKVGHVATTHRGHCLRMADSRHPRRDPQCRSPTVTRPGPGINSAPEAQRRLDLVPGYMPRARFTILRQLVEQPFFT